MTELQPGFVAHILCPRCFESYREPIERWADRRRVTIAGGRVSAEAVCTACHGRLEAEEPVVFVRWEPATISRRTGSVPAGWAVVR